MPQTYFPILLGLGLALLVGGAIVLVSWAAGSKSGGRVKLSTYESGMPLLDTSHKRLSVAFFLVAIDFVIFDVEAAFLYPLGARAPPGRLAAVLGGDGLLRPDPRRLRLRLAQGRPGRDPAPRRRPARRPGEREDGGVSEPPGRPPAERRPAREPRRPPPSPRRRRAALDACARSTPPPAPCCCPRCTSRRSTGADGCPRRRSRPSPPSSSCRRPRSTAWSPSTTSTTSGRSGGTASASAPTCPAAARQRRDDGGAREELGVEEGEVTPDGRCSFVHFECLGACDTAPMMMVDDDYHENLDARARCGGSSRAGLMARLGIRAGPAPATSARPEALTVARLPRRAAATRRSSKALRMEPDEVIERGQGVGPARARRRGLPHRHEVGLHAQGPRASPSTWCATPTSPSPAPSRTALLMEHDPHQLIEGSRDLLLGGRRERLLHLHPRRVRRAGRDPRARRSRDAYAAGILGDDVLGSGFELDMVVHRGAGAYICGEETGLLESLEGKRGQPRVKPPFPAVVGAFGCPTVINNVETLCCVPHIVERGAGLVQGDRHRRAQHRPEAVRASRATSSGPAPTRCPIGITFHELLDDCGGGHAARGRRAQGLHPRRRLGAGADRRRPPTSSWTSTRSPRPAACSARPR